MPITVTSVSPATVDFDGGYPLDILGTFPVGERLRVYIGPLGTTSDPVAHSGKPGQGFDVYSKDGIFVRCYTPQNPSGGPYTILVVAVDVIEQGSLADALTYVVAPYRAAVFNMRAVFPSVYRTGPRRIDQVPPLV